MVTGTSPGTRVKSVLIFSRNREQEGLGKRKGRSCNSRPAVFDNLANFYKSSLETAVPPVVDHTRKAKDQDGGQSNLFADETNLGEALWEAILENDVRFCQADLKIGDVYYLPAG